MLSLDSVSITVKTDGQLCCGVDSFALTYEDSAH